MGYSREIHGDMINHNIYIYIYIGMDQYLLIPFLGGYSHP